LYDEVDVGDKEKIKDYFIAPKLRKKKHEKLDELEEKYRQVASSYEARRRFGLAGHFKAGEFELRRQKLHRYSLERIILVIYRWVSFYGENIIHPLFLLLLTLFISATIYFFCGLPVAVLEGGTQKIVYWQYSIDCSAGNTSFSLQPVGDFCRALLLSLQACFPVKTNLVEMLNGFCAYIPAIQRGLTAIFLAFFLFALRRKAKR
jgi:hypothetical protein